MKALNFKPVIFVLAALLGAGSLQAQEVKKTLKEEFKTNKSTVLDMDIKFSELTVETWDKDQAVFDVTIIAESSDESLAKKNLDMMDVTMTKDGNTIKIVTEIDDKFGKVTKISNAEKEKKQKKVKGI